MALTMALDIGDLIIDGICALVRNSAVSSEEKQEKESNFVKPEKGGLDSLQSFAYFYLKKI